jgi:hypothetical protein
MANSCTKVTRLLLLRARLHALRALTGQSSLLRIVKLPLAKIYEISSLDYSFFCTFDPRSNASLLRERIRQHHDQNSASSAGTPYGGLRSQLLAAAPFWGRKNELTTL